MMKIKHKLFLFVLFFSFPALSYSFHSSPSKKTGNGTRIHFGPVIGFYTINKNHAINPRQKMSMALGFSREVHLDRSYKTFFLFGVDYFLHGLNFRSYYFSQDTLQVYDKSFAYDYALYMHELSIPLQGKYLFKREDNSLFSPYIAMTYHLRYLLASNLKVSQNGNVVKDEMPELSFKNPLFYDKLNSALSISLGWQKNSLSSSKGSFFVELNYRYGFSPYSFQSNYSASSLYINSTHLSLQLGFKF